MNLIKEKISEDTILIMIKEKDIEFSISNELKLSVENLIEKEIKNVILDFTKVRYIDSSGLGGLITIVKLLKKKQGKLSAFALDKPIKKIFNLTSIDKVLEISKTKEEALKKI